MQQIILVSNSHTYTFQDFMFSNSNTRELTAKLIEQLTISRAILVQFPAVTGLLWPFYQPNQIE